MVITLEDVASKLSSQNQITIPGKIRNALGLKPGDTIVFVEEDDKITVRNLKRFNPGSRGNFQGHRGD